jgi:putative holliday junction resolvase
MNGRAMALDVGDKRIGVALSDPTGMLASGLKTVHRTHLKDDIAEFVALIAEHAVHTIVVGWPLETSGRVGRQARRVKIVTDALAAEAEVPIVFWDERFTSVQAERVLIQGGVRRAARRQVVDKVAATLILQSWLDNQKMAT